jgi:Holliday junction resolvase
MGPERKLYKKLKLKTPKIIWNRLENISLSGTPDLLGYNNSGHFFTVELKVTKGNKLKISPHQIAFHKRHSNNSFILVKALGPLRMKTFSWSMYKGTRISELAACGLTLDADYSGLDACRLALEAV